MTGKIPAHMTAKMVMASAARFTAVRQRCRRRKRIAEMSVPAWPMPIHQTKLMMAHPHMVGGEGSFTTRVMEAYKGRLFAKNGAEGVFCFGIPKAGLGIALKIADGNDRAYQTAVIGILDRLGMAPDAGSDLPAVKDINNAKGDVVGKMNPAYKPGSFKGVKV